jgi:2-haloacid dehalogenase
VRFERLFAALRLLENAAGAKADAFSARYLQNLAEASDLMVGAENIIRALKARYRLALITNGLKDVQRPRLARSAIAGYFEVVAISEEIGAAKPDPRYFDAVFALMGQPGREACLVIGDSLTSDIQGGLNYGLDTCWFNPVGKAGSPPLPVTYEIKQLEELLPLLGV